MWKTCRRRPESFMPTVIRTGQLQYRTIGVKRCPQLMPAAERVSDRVSTTERQHNVWRNQKFGKKMTVRAVALLLLSC